MTHFLLDCFAADELELLVARLGMLATPDACWLAADFQIPDRGLAAWRSRAILALLYRFFRITCGIPAKSLASPDAQIAKAGFTLHRRETSEWGLLKSEWWQRDDHAAPLTCIDCGAYVEETTGGIAICDACFAARGSCCAEFGTFDSTADDARHGDASPPCTAHPSDDDKSTIQHDENMRRFFTASGAVLEYRMTPDGGIEVTHTFVPENLRGRGLAADLMEAAMGHARKNDLMISASCSYARIYLDRKRSSH